MSGSVYFTVTSLPHNESHEMLPRSVTNPFFKTDPSEKIRKVLEIYEEKYKVFTALSLSPEEAQQTISSILKDHLNIDIGKMFDDDNPSFNMIISAFYGRREALRIPFEVEHLNLQLLEEDDYLHECKHPLHTVMVMCFATFQMQKILLKNDFGQNLRMEKYEQLNQELEELACKLINHLYVKSVSGPRIAKQALQVDYQCGAHVIPQEHGYGQYLHRKFDQSREIMAIAYKAKAMKFLSQRPCLNLMRIRNVCRKKSSDDCDNHNMKGSRRTKQMSQKKTWWRITMREKLLFHSFCRVIYILMFAYMLCRFPTYDDYDSMKLSEFIPYFYVISVLIAQVLMTLIKVIDYLNFHLPMLDSKTNTSNLSKRLSLTHRYFHSNKLALYRMAMVIVIAIMESIRFSCFLVKRAESKLQDWKFWYSGWTVVPISLEILYCTLFSIAVVSSLRLLHCVTSLGFFVHLFKKMWRTVGMFFLIFCTFWFVLAVIHVSLSRTLLHSINSTKTIFHTVASEGKFEIFGEVRDEDRNGILINCDQFNRTITDFFDMHYAEASCLFRSSVLPFLVFGYMFIAGILLVNLLTAQLTKEYEKESENSRYYEGYLKYEQLSKIESKLFLPPPFSLIYVSIRLLSYGSKWILKNVVERMEGYPWGSVRDVDCDDVDVEVEIKQFLTKGPEDVYQDLKEIVSKYIRNGVKVDSTALSDIKDHMNKLLDTAIEDDARATRARSRAGTRLEYDDDPSLEVPLRMQSSSL